MEILLLLIALAFLVWILIVSGYIMPDLLR